MSIDLKERKGWRDIFVKKIWNRRGRESRSLDCSFRQTSPRRTCHNCRRVKQEKGEKQVEIIIRVGRNERAHGSGAQPGSAIGPRIFPHTAYLFQRLHVITSPSYSTVTIRSSPCLPRSKKKSGKSSRITFGILLKKKKEERREEKLEKCTRFERYFCREGRERFFFSSVHQHPNRRDRNRRGEKGGSIKNCRVRGI